MLIICCNMNFTVFSPQMKHIWTQFGFPSASFILVRAVSIMWHSWSLRTALLGKGTCTQLAGRLPTASLAGLPCLVGGPCTTQLADQAGK